MRPVLIGDVIAAARVLLAAPDAAWPATVDRMLAEARAADRYRRRFGRAHPAWGTGSLMAVAGGRERRAEPTLSDLRYLRALACVLDRLIAAKLSFVSENTTLYDASQTGCGGVRHGRDQSENGKHRPGLAAHL